jgi:epoxyqueuosine reductase
VQHVEKNTQWIKALAQRLGFDFCGIARAERLDEDARRLENWLAKGMHGNMQYMANHFDLRLPNNSPTQYHKLPSMLMARIITM